MAWWIWIVAGMILLAGEILTPGGLYLLFFGISAIVIGAIVALEVPLPLWGQGLGFVLLAGLSVVALRRPAQAWLKRDTSNENTGSSIIGAEAVALDTIRPGEDGSVDLNGTVWQAQNNTEWSIPIHSRCYVKAIVGVTLHVVLEPIALTAST